MEDIFESGQPGFLIINPDRYIEKIIGNVSIDNFNTGFKTHGKIIFFSIFFREICREDNLFEGKMIKDWQNSIISIIYHILFRVLCTAHPSCMLQHASKLRTRIASVGDNKSRNKATNYRFKDVKSTRVQRSIPRTFLHSLTQILENMLRSILIKTNLPKPRIDNGEQNCTVN